MSFSWPFLLPLLLLVPLLALVYVWIQRRRRRYAVRYASLLLVRQALPRHSRWRRHVPAAFFLASVASLVVALARPQAVVAVPTSRTSIILTLDVSLSMCATDVKPNRLAVAQDVARAFVKEQAGDVRIGIVAFGGFAQLIVPPTTDTAELVDAIDGLTTSRGTAVGSALLRAIDAIAEVNPDVQRSGIELNGGSGTNPSAGQGLEPDVVVLLTDGATTQGVDPIVAAEQAVARGVRVYTIGFGTTDVAPLSCSRAQLGSETFGGFGGGFGGGGGQGGPPRQFLVIDEDTLQTVADMTGGTYHQARDAEELVDVFRGLPTEFATQKEERELSVVFAALAGVLGLAAVGLSMAWNRYP